MLLSNQLERLIGALSPGLADLPKEEVTDEPITQLLRDAAALHRQGQPAPGNRIAAAQGEAIQSVSPEALLALARALAGPKSVRYRAASRSSKGSFYELDVDSGGDVTCSCPGFSYRGMCSHARDLKAILRLGGALPAQYTQGNN